MDSRTANGLIARLLRKANEHALEINNQYISFYQKIFNRTRSGTRISSRFFNNACQEFLAAIENNPFALYTDYAPMSATKKDGHLIVHRLTRCSMSVEGRKDESLFFLDRISLIIKSKQWHFETKPLPITISSHLIHRYMVRTSNPGENWWKNFFDQLEPAIKVAPLWLESLKDIPDNDQTFSFRLNDGLVLGSRIHSVINNYREASTWSNRQGLCYGKHDDALQCDLISFRTFVEDNLIQDRQDDALDVMHEWARHFSHEIESFHDATTLQRDHGSHYQLAKTTLKKITLSSEWKRAFSGKKMIVTNSSLNQRATLELEH